MSSAPDPLLSSDAVLAPRGAQLTLADAQALRRVMVAPWHAGRVEALAFFSDSILRHPDLRRDPAATALAFWLRRAGLNELKRSFPSGPGECRVPAGLVLHITPANVDTMFVYSWALSFLAGNANIVRLTTNPSRLMADLIERIAAVFSQHPEAMAGNYFVSYGHDDAITGALSAWCDLRIVWGGDETVRRLRAVPLNPHAAERSFASKRSLSVFDAAAFRITSPAARRQLAERMVGDILPFAQMACSSPHQVYWIGAPELAEVGIAEFGRDLEAAFTAKGVEVDTGAVMRRINVAFAAAAAGSAGRATLGSHTATVVATTPVGAEQAEPCGAGLLFHAACDRLETVAALLRVDHQTITYFGLAPEARDHLARLAGMAGVDRVMPVGRALEFSAEWDGFALWADLTRQVTVR